VTFKTAEDRDAYLVHPAHKEFVKLVGPIVDDVFVIDFWAEK
jgi:Stress responsive A/B Barrel Domain